MSAMICGRGTMSTPQKSNVSGVDEMFLIEDIEKKLMSFSHLLEKSSEKEKTNLMKITEQTSLITSLKVDNENLADENEKWRSVVQNYMQNFTCFIDNLKRTTVLEQENLALQQKFEQYTSDTNEQIVDLELEKNHFRKLNSCLAEENAKLKEENSQLKGDLEKLNQLILDSFKKTPVSREDRIKKLEKELAAKNGEVDRLKMDIALMKENHDKNLKSKNADYENLRMDFEGVQSGKSRQKSSRNDRKKKNEDISEQSDSESIAEKKKEPLKPKVFNIISTKTDSPDDSKPVRKTTRRLRKTAEIEKPQPRRNYYDMDDDFIDDGTEEEEASECNFDDNGERSSDEDFEEEETLTVKKGKRKVKEAKKKGPSKKVKKNENKELLAVNRNTIQYHLFN